MLITKPSDFKSAIKQIESFTLLAVNVFSDSNDFVQSKVSLIQIETGLNQYSFDCRKKIPWEIECILRSDRIKVFFDAKNAYKLIKNSSKISIERIVDVAILEKIIQGGKFENLNSLENIASNYNNVDFLEIKNKYLLPLTMQFSEDFIKKSELELKVLYNTFLQQIEVINTNKMRIVVKLECGAISAFADMESAGIYLDEKAWDNLLELQTKLKNEVKNKLDNVFHSVLQTDLFGNIIANYESDQEILRMFAELGVTLENTNKYTLSKCEHPAAQIVLQYRRYQKNVSAYGDTFLSFVNKKTGRIHPNFDQIGASTGRVSCSSPNLQSIKGDIEFRKCFRAPDKKRIITADYSGCELRILAEMSNDPFFIKVFNEGGDLHSMVASELWGLTVSKTENSEFRKKAKAINFGLLYGMSSPGLARALDITKTEAELLLINYFKRFEKVGEFLKINAEQSIKKGYARSMSGRRLYFNNDMDLSAKQRLARNMPIQGTSADITKLALTMIRKAFINKKIKAFIINCVHDEIVVESPISQVKKAMGIVERGMVQAGCAFLKKVPVEVDISEEDYWSK